MQPLEIEVILKDGRIINVYKKGLKLIENDYVKSAHDVSLGGIITAITKMCIKGISTIC